MLGMRRHCEENHWSCELYGSNEESRGCKGVRQVHGGHLCIDIFQGVYFLGEVFCLGLGFLFLSHPPRILCVVIFIFGNFVQMLWFFLDLTIVVSSERVKREREEVGVNKLELFASESFFFSSTNANQLLSWKAVANSPQYPGPYSLFIPKQTMVN